MKRRPLPVAEPTYPPPTARDGSVLLWAGLVVLGLAGVLVTGAYAFSRRGGPVEIAVRQRSSEQFKPLVDEYYGRAIEGPGGAGLVTRLDAVALLHAPAPLVARRPAAAPRAVQVRILSVQARRVSLSITGGLYRSLLLVAFEVAPEARLPRSGATETAEAYVGSGYTTYPADAVVLVHWSEEQSGGQGRVHAIDFIPDGEVGVAVAAVEPPQPGGRYGAVAFALGDPLAGSGQLISRWSPVGGSG